MRLETAVTLGAGALGSGSGGPPGANDAPVICGRRLVDAEAVVERRRQARQRRLVGLADHHGLNVLEAFGQGAGR